MSKYVFLWCDLETTGLDVQKGAIMEASFCLTTPTMNVLLEADTVVQCRDFAWLPTFIWEGHSKNGLQKEWLNSHEKPVINDIDKHLCFSIIGKVPPDVNIILAGSSIHFDRAWIERWMPRLSKILHYRMLDIRSILMAFETVGIQAHLHEGQTSGTAHRARPDRIWAMNAFKGIRKVISSRAL